jgi:hypothetical protein
MAASRTTSAVEQTAGDPDCEEVLKTPVPVLVVMVVRVAAPHAGAQHACSHAHDEERGDEVEPRVEPLRDDELRKAESHEPEREDAGRVRHGHGQSEQ